MSLKYEVRLTPLHIMHRRHGMYHRESSCADVWKNGDMFWYEYGVTHRLNGPSDVFCDGDKQYCIRGTYYNKDEYESKIRS